MADNVFRVEVGAQIAASTEGLKKDIQSILNEISKTPPEVTISANKSKSRAAIKKNLEDMFKGNSSVGVTLGLKGGSNLRGSTGQAIKKDLAGITKALSDQQAAKVTLHIDTTATQKAMLAELKKLDLGVAITAKDGPGNGGNAKQATKDQTKYNAAVKEAVRLTAEAATLEKQALSKGAEGAEERKRQAAENRASAESVRNEYLKTAEAAKNGVTASDFDNEVQGNQQVTSAIRARAVAEKDLLDAQNKAANSSDARANTQQTKAIDSAKAKIQTLVGRLNTSSSAGMEAKAKFEALSASFDGAKLSAAQMNEQIRKVEKAAKDAGAMAETAGEKFSRMLGTKVGYAAITLLLAQVRNGFRQIYTNVVEIDTGMTELKKVTDETDQVYSKFLDNAAVRAKQLGATISDTVNATASFARLGYSLDEAAQLADAAVVYNHVGDEIESIDDASNSVISTMQAFGIEAENVMSIVDKFNTIGNKFAISSGGAGEAMQRSAAALQAAGNTIDESLAMIAAANTTAQDPDVVGTAMKTISMYLRAAKTEAEAAGESTDGMANSVSELRDELKMLTNDRVDIMLDDKTFKSTYQILKEISEVWDDLSDITRANILEKLAGKRQANIVASLLENFDIAEQALLESHNAAGSALAENEKYLDSINGKLDQLKASWEQLSVSVLSSEVVKGLIDFLRSVIELFNRMDEATNGVSSGLLALLTVFGLGKTVFSAFKFQAKDTTTLLGSLWSMLSGGSHSSSASALERTILRLKSSLIGLYSNFVVVQTATGSFSQGLLAATKVALPYVAGLVAIAGALYGAYKIQEKYNPSLSDLRENTEELQSEVDELNSSLETNKKRIEELQALADNGTISFVEQDELDRLNTENELLETQLRLKQSLLEIAEGKEADKARSDAEAFFSGSPVTLEGEDGSSILTSLAGFETQKERIKVIDAEIAELTQQAASATGKDADKILQRIQQLQQERQSAIGAMSNIADPLVTMMDSLDPVKDSALIDRIQTLVYQVQYLSDDATALSQIWDDLWGDESRFPGITDFKKQIVAAAAAQKEFNDELAQYGGNVDMTARPNVTVTRDMVEGGLWSFDDEYSTVNSVTYTSDDFKDFGVQGTSAIVVTPIMPDGNTFDSEEDLYNYLASLIQDGEFHFENDTEGIIMGVVDEGSVEKSLEKAAEIEQKAHEINAWYYDLLRSDQFKEISDAFAEIGIDLSQYPAGELAEMFERLGVSAEAAETSISGLADALDALTEKMDLLKSAQEEYNTYGALSASTLSDIAEKFPELEESIGLYIAGMKSGKELLEDLTGAYQEDVSEYKDSMVQKLAASNAFYNSLSEKQKQHIKDLASSYDVDLGNFKTIEAAKLNFQAQIIQKLAQNYSKYTGKTLAQLKAYRDSLDNSAWKENNPEYQALTEAIKAAEAFNSNMDDIISGKLETWSPSTFKDHSSSSSSSTDTYKKSVEEKIDALKHQLAMEKITAEQYYNGLEAIENQYYKDSSAHLQKYADEIRSIDEELFEGRRELNEDWLNDQQDFAERAGAGGDYAAQQDYYNGMFSKLQEMIKATKDYGLDESSDYVQELYDKVEQLQSDILASVKASFEDFESYMDDFDLWKGSDFSKLDWLKHELNEIIALYDQGQLSWAQYTEARNEIAKKMYDTQRDSLEEILELTMDMIKAEAEDQVEAIDDQIDA